MMEISLKGQVILVTGASRGIGAGITTQLLAAGARVAVHYNGSREHAAALCEGHENDSQLFQADLSDATSTINLFKQVKEHFGQIDGLVNNAGVAVSSPDRGDEIQWVKDWDFTMNVNLRACGLLCKMALEHFRERGGGRMVNISSRAAFRGDTSDYLAYAASKAGVVALTRSIARAYGKQNIKAFNIAPGFVRTDMAQDFMDQYGEDYALNDIALNTLTEPKDLAPTVAFLLSGMADHATGCTIDINAGSYVH
jgi:NAD(P)-dependent dehydrogenase (short-subunit alcohol dehydrogenase family)